MLVRYVKSGEAPQDECKISESVTLRYNKGSDLTLYPEGLELWQGAYGSVRIFSNKNESRRRFTVKLFDVTDDENISEVVLNSVQIFRAVYPMYLISIGSFGIEFGDDNEGILMPYFKGQTLQKSLLESKSQFEFLSLIRGAAIEINKMHERARVVHGDLKFDNILELDSGEIRIIDFDLSTYIGMRCKKKHCIVPKYNTFEGRESGDRTILASPKQDILSFAYWVDSLKDQLPVGFFTDGLITFIMQAYSYYPEDRPSLSKLIDHLGIVIHRAPKLYKAAVRFTKWMREFEDSHREKGHLDDKNKALVAFLDNDRGFRYIKTYEELCNLAELLQDGTEAGTSNPPCSIEEFALAIECVDPRSFGDDRSVMPDDHYLASQFDRNSLFSEDSKEERIEEKDGWIDLAGFRPFTEEEKEEKDKEKRCVIS